jgi:hypothetical protein
LSATFNLVCEQATTFNFQFQILNNATPWNINGYSATMTVRPFAGSTVTTLSATTANGLIVLDGNAGRITVTVPFATTAEFTPGRFVYDLILDSGTVVTRILEGRFVVTAAITT